MSNFVFIIFQHPKQTLEGIFDINSTDTICAVSTAPGKGGIAVIRVSGPKSIEIVGRIWDGKPLSAASPRTAHFGRILDGNELLDEAVVTIFRAPASYTGEDIVEISVHGSPYVQRRLLQLLTADQSLCRLALPGEFTRRAFRAGKLDLSQSEAVADIIAATTRGAHRLAVNQLKGGLSRRINNLRDSLIELASLLELELDFSEEDVEFASRPKLIRLAGEIDSLLRRLENSYSTGQAIVNGLPVVIAGAPNAGKSTLLNQLLDDERAIVSDIPGTTRDIIEDTAEIGHILFRFIDTAGLRNVTPDSIEQEGINRAVSRIERADILLYLFDATSPIGDRSQFEAWQSVVKNIGEHPLTLVPVVNKTDLVDSQTVNLWRKKIQELIGALPDNIVVSDTIVNSSVRPTDLEHLEMRLVEIARQAMEALDVGDAVLTNVRHLSAIRSARTALDATLAGLSDGLSPDLVAHHLRSAINALGEITGTITTPDLLSTIFSRFCIGK